MIPFPLATSLSTALLPPQKKPKTKIKLHIFDNKIANFGDLILGHGILRVEIELICIDLLIGPIFAWVW